MDVIPTDKGYFSIVIPFKIKDIKCTAPKIEKFLQNEV